jgi:hypothetical protein
MDRQAYLTVGDPTTFATSSNLTLETSKLAPHPRYFCHLTASNQVADDSTVYDISGAKNHAVKWNAAQLSNAQIWANSGYFSTVNPTSGAYQSALMLPILNFDMVGGESILIYWLGKATPEVASAYFGSDNSGGAGVLLNMLTTGQLNITMFAPAGNRSITPTTALPFDGTLHSFAFFYNGTTNTYSTWVDEVAQSSDAAFGTRQDTRSSLNFILGSSNTGSFSEGRGAAIQSRVFSILRWSPTDVMPTRAKVEQAIKILRAVPYRPLSTGAFI